MGFRVAFETSLTFHFVLGRLRNLISLFYELRLVL